MFSRLSLYISISPPRLRISSLSLSGAVSDMIPHLEKAKITEIHVRMDCNGCVHKIKKAIHGLNGIYEHYIDFQQQKLTIVGWIDPQLVIKAIKKTRKIATICSHSDINGATPDSTSLPVAEQPTPPTECESKPADPAPPTPEPANPPPPAEAPPPAEPTPPPPAESTPPPPPPPPEPEKPAATETPTPQPPQEIKEVAENIQLIDHSARNGPWYHFHGMHELPQISTYANTYAYRPTVHVIPEPVHYIPAPNYSRYNRIEHYSDEYYPSNRSNGEGNSIASMFSDENPNACTVM